MESARGLGIQVTQFSHPNLNMIEEILYASRDAGIDKDIKYEYRTADLIAYSEFDDQLIKDVSVLYERKKQKTLTHIMNLVSDLF